MEEHSSHLDETDEFPGLGGKHRDDSVIKQAPIDACLAALSEAIDRAEYRWQELEQRLRTQDQSIASLEAIAKRPEPPRLTEVVADGPDEREQPEPDLPADTGSAFRARIAELEAYITGRAEYWQAMEDEIEARARRIGELETELSQRIEREEHLNSQLHAESSRVDQLRGELAELRQRMTERQNGG